MTTNVDDASETTGWPIRDSYEVYEFGHQRVSVITDPENESAWILSDHTAPIVP